MLPELRDDIVVYPGPTNFAGEPSWTVHDPARNRFFRVDWLTYEILGRWSFRDAGVIADMVSSQSPLHITSDDVDGVSRFLIDSELIKPHFPGSSAFLNDRLRKRQKSWGEWLLHHYLFVRIPLVRPDEWLARHLRHASGLASALFMRLTLVALVFGLWQTFRQWEQFRTTLVDTLTPSGFLSYGLTLIGVKIAHELGHAFTTKYYGCRVPTMGVALLVMWPVAYTDTTDTWKLNDKHKRLHVACAGVAVELAIAAWATAAWALLPDGPVRSAAFLLATTTWISAVVVNFNPLMRFDGYFILSDWLDIPNLHERAFALARWQMRQLLLGLQEPPPERFPAGTQRILIVLAWVTWAYRLVLYLGIAFLVYHFFIKLVGILLFVVEMWWFILKPVTAEMKVWWERRGEWLHNPRARRIAWGAAGLLALLMLPLPAPTTSTAVLTPQELHIVYAPEAGRIEQFRRNIGASIAKGEPVAVIASPAIANQRSIAAAQVESLRQQLTAAAVDPSQRPRLLVLQSELQAAEANLGNSLQETERLELRAPFAGKLADVDPDLQPGEWISKGSPIAAVVNDTRWHATAYVDASEVHRIEVGDRARFVAEGTKSAPVDLIVAEVDPDSSRSLPSGIFSSSAGGDIAVRAKDGRLVPEHSVYRVRLVGRDVPDSLGGHSWRGKVSISGSWSSLGWRYLEAAVAVLVREASF